MEETLISFKTAKLAKEKGLIGIKTMYYYYKGKLDMGVWDDGELDWNGEPYDNMVLDEYHSAPTQSLLQKWLREEHKIHLCVSVHGSLSTWFEVEILEEIEMLPIKARNGCYDNTDFNTYEEALEDALYQALELIK